MSTATTTCRTIRFKAEPKGHPVPDEVFSITTDEVPDLQPGQVLMRLVSFSVDPYMRPKMRQGVKSYTPPYAIGEVMAGAAVCAVEKSENEAFAAGARYFTFAPWSTLFVLGGDALKAARPVPEGIAPDFALGALGMPGLTAYFGLFDVGAPKAGETVLVSGAAGATGSTVVQLAKIAGCKVVGIAGGAEKCDLVRGLGADNVIDYKAAKPGDGEGSLAAEIDRCCPDGVDVYFDNVGGDTLRAAFSRMRDFGRIISCGAISQYNSETPAADTPLPMFLTVSRRLTLRGFIVTDFAPRFAEGIAALGKHVAEGKLRNVSTIVKGFDKAGEAFAALFTGGNKGKMVVEV